VAKADEFWSEKEFIAIKDEKALSDSSRYRETVKYRAKAKILRAFDGMLKVENPRIVTNKILVKSFEVTLHFLKLRGFHDEAKIVEDMQKAVSVAVLSDAEEADER